MVGIFTEYCGPDVGFWQGSGVPRNKIDAICAKHDALYSKYLRRGKNPYTHWNKADEWMVRQVKKLMLQKPSWKEKIVGEISNSIWKYKQRLAPSFTQDEELPLSNFQETTQAPMRPKRFREVIIDPVEPSAKRLSFRELPRTAQPDPVPDTAVMSNTNDPNTKDETQVDRIPYSKISPWRETEQVQMTCYHIMPDLTVATGSTTNSVQYFTLRLNSIYDVLKTTVSNIATGTTENADFFVNKPVADAADGTLVQPSMRQYWTTFYDFWTVVKTQWRIRIIPLTQSDTGELTSYIYFHGAQFPPVYNMETNGSNFYRVEHQYRDLHPQCIWKHVRALPQTNTSGVTQNYQNYAQEFSGTWYPGSVNKDVVEDDMGEIWIGKNETPKAPDYLTFMVQKSPLSGDVEQKVRVELHLEYHVQLKDLNPKYKYITKDTDIPAITNFANAVATTAAKN
jgi:hypothetical protein